MEFSNCTSVAFGRQSLAEAVELFLPSNGSLVGRRYAQVDACYLDLLRLRSASPDSVGFFWTLDSADSEHDDMVTFLLFPSIRLVIPSTMPN